jgi:hypothetical protein
MNDTIPESVQRLAAKWPEVGYERWFQAHSFWWVPVGDAYGLPVVVRRAICCLAMQAAEVPYFIDDGVAVEGHAERVAEVCGVPLSSLWAVLSGDPARIYSVPAEHLAAVIATAGRWAEQVDLAGLMRASSRRRRSTQTPGQGPAA